MTDHLIDHRYTVIEIERVRRATNMLMFPFMLIRLRPTHTSHCTYAVYPVYSHRNRAHKKGVGRMAPR